MRNTTYFISDLHLSSKDVAITERFRVFISEKLADAECLYILGDLFEYWVGDDGVDFVGMRENIDLLRSLTDSGIKGYFVAGNRDFLVGEAFAKMTGFTLLPDYSVVDLYGDKTVILHGDALCTDDTVHQEFRDNIMLNKAWQAVAMTKTIEERIALATQMRGSSKTHKMTLTDEIMDVTEATVIQKFADMNVQQMIHGHTHRPNRHQYSATDNFALKANCERIVLGDWYSQTSYIRVNKDGLELINE